MTKEELAAALGITVKQVDALAANAVAADREEGLAKAERQHARRANAVLNAINNARNKGENAPDVVTVYSAPL